MEYKKKNLYTCCFCHMTCFGYGNYPTPLGKRGDRCCDRCNAQIVVPARIEAILKLDESETLITEK